MYLSTVVISIPIPSAPPSSVLFPIPVFLHPYPVNSELRGLLSESGVHPSARSRVTRSANNDDTQDVLPQ